MPEHRLVAHFGGKGGGVAHFFLFPAKSLYFPIPKTQSRGDREKFDAERLRRDAYAIAPPRRPFIFLRASAFLLSGGTGAGRYDEYHCWY